VPKHMRAVIQHPASLHARLRLFLKDSAPELAKCQAYSIDELA
jgi:hypothetical protein